MLIIDITKSELTGGHIRFMLTIEITKIELTGGHIGFMLFIEMAKIELTGGHIGIMLKRSYAASGQEDVYDSYINYEKALFDSKQIDYQ